MADPDITSGTSYGAIIGIFLFIYIIVIFQYKNNNTIFLVVGIIIISFICGVLCNAMSQSSVCTTRNFAQIIKGAVVTTVACLFGFIISNISFLRIPVASVVASWYPSPIPMQSCCKSESLEQLELRAPVVMAYSMGFYVLFGAIFGMTYGNNIAITC
jgi:hypothetical protein